MTTTNTHNTAKRPKGASLSSADSNPPFEGIGRRISLSELAKRLGVRPSTVYGWVDKGVLVGRDRIRLACIRLGGRRFVSDEQYRAFEAACNPSSTPPQPGNPARDLKRAKESQALAARLLSGGVA